MERDYSRLIQALVSSELVPHQERGKGVEHPVVAVSRSYASGGEEFAQRLAEALAVTYYDHELLIKIAEDAKVDAHLMARLDEHVKGIMNDWVYNIITGKSAYRDDYRRHLVNVALGIMNTGGVLVGRGVNIILRKHHAFRVRIVGSDEVCAQRVTDEEGLDEVKALEKVRKLNAERAEFIRATYETDINDPSHYDLVINTDHFSIEDAVELTLAAMKRSGFRVHEGVA